MTLALRSKWWSRATVLGLALLVLWLYLPSLGYGIWWDDPITFWAAAGKSLPEFFGDLGSSPYFRPLTLFFRSLWWRDGVLDARAIHVAQLSFHLMAVLLTLVLTQAWTGSRLAAVLAALIFAVFPFSHQAVSWTATPQLLLTVLILTSVLAYTWFRVGGRRLRWLAASLGTFAAALFVQEAAAPLCLLFPLIELRPPRSDAGGAARVRWTLGHLLLTGVYCLLFLQADRQSGHSGLYFQPEVPAYLLQAVALPIARLTAFVAGEDAGEQAVLWMALFLFVWLAVAWALVRSGQGQLALLTSAWIALVLAAPWAFLDWEYVMIAPRLVYPAAPAIASMWAMLAATALAPERDRALRLAAATGLVVFVGLSVLDVRAQDRLLAAGAEHLGEAIAVQDSSSERLLFINFPDRYQLRHPPYPLGHWGVTLAPVVQSLSDYAATLTGHGAETASWSMPQVDDEALRAWPYQTDLRGVRIEWPALVAEARQADQVYLSRFLPGGGLRLDPVGGFRPPDTGLLGDFGLVQLESAHLSQVDGQTPPRLHLTWRRGEEPGPELEDTVFVHLVDETGRPLANADGDAWGGLLPPKAWPRDRAVLDVRTVDVSRLPPGRYALKVGFYNRATGQRYPLTGTDGRPSTQDAVVVGEVLRR